MLFFLFNDVIDLFMVNKNVYKIYLFISFL
jgi:hypothetical protein